MTVLPTRSLYIISASCVLAGLYFGRGVLQPLALAAILSIALAPLTRRFSRLGLANLPATLATVIVSATCLLGLAAVLAVQLSDLTTEVPRYRQALQAKADQVKVLVERPFAVLEERLDGGQPRSPAATRAAAKEAQVQARAAQAARRPGIQETATKVLTLAWGPLGQAGIVLVLFVFISLEHESLQDRFVRLAGDAGIGRTLQTLTDAAQGISRFFFAQVIVNVSFGLAVALCLWLLQIPHAILWGALSGVLRFVPYLGMLIAGATIGLFAAAVDPGWSLALSCMALFLVLEVAVAYAIEPSVYGHTSGLSPLAVIVAALFWGALWGPVGLVLSTPLTLCLVVAGRHVPALAPLSTLLGAAPKVSEAQRFYQRALAGDTAAMVRDGRSFLKRATLAAYCDQVMAPGMALAFQEVDSGRIDAAQLDRLRKTVVTVIEALSAPGAALSWRRRPVSLLDTNIGSHLRKLRQARSGQWQGPLDVPEHSILLCAGLGSNRDDFLSEMLVRVLSEAGADARSVALNRAEEDPGEDKAHLVSSVFMPYPAPAAVEAWLDAVAGLRAAMPHASVLALKLPMTEKIARAAEVEAAADLVVHSFGQARAFAGK